MTDITAHGALVDGVTDDTFAWIAAIAAAEGGDRLVTMPPGISLVSDHDSDTAALNPGGTGINIRGAGPGISTVRLADDQDAHVFSLTGWTSGGISDLTVDGNRENQVAGHCIRGADILAVRLERLEIVNASGYGLGFQAGAIRDLTIRDVTISGCGGDGIDIKNADDANSGILIESVRVRNFGLNSELTTQAAIDLRGPCIVQGIVIEGVGENPAGTVGVRMRHGELGDSTGLGAHRSLLSAFHITGASKTGTLGVNAVARDVHISDGFVSGVLRAVQCQQEGSLVSGVHAHDCSDGFYLANGGVPTHGDNGIVSGSRATACTRGFRTARQNVQFIGCGAENCGSSFQIDAAAASTRITGGYSLYPTGAHVNDAGIGTVKTALLEL